MPRPTLNRRAPLAAGLLTLLVAAPVVAGHVTPEVVDGAESCAPLAEGTVELIVSLPDGAGSIAEGDFEIDVALVGGVTGGTISFSGATLPIQAAFVAGADSGNLYRYEEPVTEDDGLVAPDGAPIQDVSFCYVSEGEGATDGDGGDGASDGDDGDGAAGDGQGGSEASPPATDTVPRTDAASPAGAVLMGLGLVALAAGVALHLRGRPTTRRTR